VVRAAARVAWHPKKWSATPHGRKSDAGNSRVGLMAEPVSQRPPFERRHRLFSLTRQLFVWLPAIFSHRIPAHLNPMSIVDQAVENAISERGNAWRRVFTLRILAKNSQNRLPAFSERRNKRGRLFLERRVQRVGASRLGLDSVKER
jgi:hypothetical protein